MSSEVASQGVTFCKSEGEELCKLEESDPELSILLGLDAAETSPQSRQDAKRLGRWEPLSTVGRLSTE